MTSADRQPERPAATPPNWQRKPARTTVASATMVVWPVQADQVAAERATVEVRSRSLQLRLVRRVHVAEEFRIPPHGQRSSQLVPDAQAVHRAAEFQEPSSVPPHVLPPRLSSPYGKRFPESRLVACACKGRADSPPIDVEGDHPHVIVIATRSLDPHHRGTGRTAGPPTARRSVRATRMGSRPFLDLALAALLRCYGKRFPHRGVINAFRPRPGAQPAHPSRGPPLTAPAAPSQEQGAAGCHVRRSASS